jgi:phosphatidylglycerophosphate synthase
MVSSIKQLNKLLAEKNKPILSRTFRYLSIFLAKPLLYTPITANQVSFVNLFLPLISAFLFTFNNYTYSVIASLILFFSVILDFVDGDIAKYKKQKSLYGVYLECLYHEIAMPFVFLGLGINAYNHYNNNLFIYLGVFVILMVFIMNIVRLNKYKIILQSKKGLDKEFSPALAMKKNKTHLQKIVFFIIGIFTKITMFWLVMLLFSVFNLLHYAISLYAIFYLIIGTSKIFIELRTGFKEFENG